MDFLDTPMENSKNHEKSEKPRLRMLHQVEHGHDQSDTTNQHIGSRQGLIIRGMVSMAMGFVAMTCINNDGLMIITTVHNKYPVIL